MFKSRCEYGTTIHDAIFNIDNATVRKPVCYMTNCVHPTVLRKALSFQFNQTNLVKKRFGGTQANTSPLSPEELDNCCDTDNTHIEEIAKMMKKQ